MTSSPVSAEPGAPAGRSLIAVLVMVAVVAVGCSGQPPAIHEPEPTTVLVDPDATDAESVESTTTAAAEVADTSSPSTTPPSSTVDSSPETSMVPESSVPETTTTTVPPPTTISEQERHAALCDAYVRTQGFVYESEYFAALRAMQQSLPTDVPEDVAAMVNHLYAEDRMDPTLYKDLHLALEQYVGGVCWQTFHADVDGTDGDVAEEFLSAVIAGRHDVAATLAPTHVLARFEPWEPWEATDPVLTPSILSRGSDTFVMVLSRSVQAECTHTSRYITSCWLNEG